MSGSQFAGARLSRYGLLKNRRRCIPVMGSSRFDDPNTENAAGLNEQPMSLMTADPLNKFIVTA
jgi:hypothetical protein